MVVPDRVVQAQRLVALAPLVAGPLVLVDDDRGHAELPQPRAERDAALAAADDQHVRLRGVAERLSLVLPLLRPRPRCPGRLPCTAPSTRDGPLRLLVALQFLQRRQQRPRLRRLLSRRCPTPRPTAVSNSMNAETTPPSSVGVLAGAEARRVGAGEAFAEHVGDLVAALDGLDVPGERDQVAPEAVGGELRDRAIDVAGGQRRLEIGEPGGDPLLRSEAGGTAKRLRHVTHHTPSRRPPQGLQRGRLAGKCDGEHNRH